MFTGAMEASDESAEIPASPLASAARSWASSPAIRRSMQGNQSRDTKPEMAVRRLLHSRGFRYRVNARPVPGLRRTADIVFGGPHIAVLIDGCFLHGCPIHHRSPSANSDYWLKKVTRNAERDLETTTLVTARDWLVLHFWAHTDAAEVASNIANAAQLGTPTRPRRSAQTG